MSSFVAHNILTQRIWYFICKLCHYHGLTIIYIIVADFVGLLVKSGTLSLFLLLSIFM